MPDPARPDVDVVDSTWLAAAPAAVGPLIDDAAAWSRWWPGLALRVDERRGAEGVRWFVDGVAEAEPDLTGSAEVWLQPSGGGTIAHFILRLDTVSGRPAPRALVERVADRYRRLTKQAFWALGDGLDPGRLQRLTSVPRPPAS